MITRRVQFLGRTNAERKRLLMTTISHAAMHAASPSLQDVPVKEWLLNLHKSLFPRTAVVIAPQKGNKA